MKNITVSLDDDLYRQARIAAAKADTSVTALVREFFAVLTSENNGRMMAADVAVLDAIKELRERHPAFDPSDRLPRDDVHRRD